MKCRLLEALFAQKIDQVRTQELKAFSRYCDIKNGCGAIYYNAGVIISAFVFILTDKENLELGKVFSTLALLGYIFNFSITYSNYAIESLYALSVLNKRIDQVITGPLLLKHASTKNRKAQKAEAANYPVEFRNVAASWQSDSSVANVESATDDSSAIISEATFKLEQGTNVGVIGPVGGGKSTLLMAILGEVPIIEGTVLTRAGVKMTLAE